MAKMCTLKELRNHFGDFGWASSNQCPNKYQAVSQSNNRIKVSSIYADNQLFPLNAAELALIPYTINLSGSIHNYSNTSQNVWIGISSEVTGSVSSRWFSISQPWMEYVANQQLSDWYGASLDLNDNPRLGHMTLESDKKPSLLAITIRIDNTLSKRIYGSVNVDIAGGITGSYTARPDNSHNPNAVYCVFVLQLGQTNGNIYYCEADVDGAQRLDCIGAEVDSSYTTSFDLNASIDIYEAY
jgi:hypothetical protein